MLPGASVVVVVVEPGAVVVTEVVVDLGVVVELPGVTTVTPLEVVEPVVEPGVTTVVVLVVVLVVPVVEEYTLPAEPPSIAEASFWQTPFASNV